MLIKLYSCPCHSACAAAACSSPFADAVASLRDVQMLAVELRPVSRIQFTPFRHRALSAFFHISFIIFFFFAFSLFFFLWLVLLSLLSVRFFNIHDTYLITALRI